MKKSGFRQLIERIFLAPAATPGLQCVHQFNTVRRTQRLPATIGLEIHLGLLFIGTRTTGKSGSVKSESTPSVIQPPLAFTPSKCATCASRFLKPFTSVSEPGGKQ